MKAGGMCLVAARQARRAGKENVTSVEQCRPLRGGGPECLVQLLVTSAV